MKTVGVAVVAAIATSITTCLLFLPAIGPRRSGSLVEDLRQELRQLRERLEEGEAELGPTLQARGVPQDTPVSTVDKTLAELHLRVSALERGHMEVPASAAPGHPTVLEDGEAAREHERRISSLLQKARGLSDPDRHARLMKLALRERNSRWHESEEKILRELVNDAGIDSTAGLEAAYQIGYARANRRDYAGAREAWLEVAMRFPRGHWRRAYAQFNAADAAKRLGDAATAKSEAEALLDELEDEPGGNPQISTIIERTKRLVAD